VAKKHAGQITIQLSDNGCGMSNSQRQRIFEPFYTTKEVGKGLGLGMSITHNIVHDFGGTIHIASQLDQGTEVTLCLNTTSCS
jgi:C4-dicarboxylate-specific signal transduction histidine kinase